MKTSKPYGTRLALVIGTICLLQACAIPSITRKEADSVLPERYPGPDSVAADAELMDWGAFFEDPQLVRLIETALAGNRELSILMQRINRAANEIDARKGEYLPFVGIGAVAELEKAGTATRNGAVEEQLSIHEEEFPDPLPNLGVGLRASWELDVWKKLRNGSKAATLEYLASVEGRNFLRTRLIAEVANGYYELLALDNLLDNLDRNIDILQDALETTEELRNFGRGSSLAISRFHAELSRNRSKRMNIQQELVATENSLNILLGRAPQPIARASDTLMTRQPPVLRTGIPSELLKNRPDIRRAELELAASELNIDIARANFYPSFAIRAGVGFEAFDSQYLLDTPDSLMYSLSGDMIAPLINRRAIEAAYRNASAAQIEAAYEYEQTVLRAFAEVSTNISRIDKLARQYELKDRQVEALMNSVDIANELFSSARADYLEILLAQREALEARNELIETRQQQLSATVNLYQSLGGGWQSVKGASGGVE